MLVGQFLEANLVGLADVVHQALDRAEGRSRLSDELLGGGGLRQVACDSERGADIGTGLLDPVGVPPVDHYTRPFRGEQPGGLEPDARG